VPVDESRPFIKEAAVKMISLTYRSNASSPAGPEVGHHASNGSRSAAAIEARGLRKRFGDVLAVDHVTFAVRRGSVVGFLGPNGAGKTTTLRMLLGLVAPTEGIATINGRLYGQLSAPPHVVGAVLDSSASHPGRTARNHLRIHALATGAPAGRVGEALELVELTDAADRRVGGFSLGMRQRLGLATALLCDPEILILDEPGNGLDPEGIRWLRGLLRGLAREGRTVLVSSHILAEVAQTADSVLIMDHGRLVIHATLDELVSAAGRRVQVRSPRAAQLAAALAEHGASVRPLDAERVEVTGATVEQIGTLAAERAIAIFEIATETPDLEDVFLRLTTHTQENGKEMEVSA
jgi:ABC-2 type transport system ATP-binding protein